MHKFFSKFYYSLSFYLTANNLLARMYSFVEKKDGRVIISPERLLNDDLTNIDLFNGEEDAAIADPFFGQRGCVLLHDQEPILYTEQRDRWMKFKFMRGDFDDRMIVFHSEKNSSQLNSMLKEMDACGVHFFSNGYLAHLWYKEEQYNLRIDSFFDDKTGLKYRFSSMNRLIGQQRIYRPILAKMMVDDLDTKKLVLSCRVTDPHSGKSAYQCLDRTIPAHHADLLKKISETNEDVSINIPVWDKVDHPDGNSSHDALFNSFFLDVFCHIATETMFYDDTIHLTEKSLRSFVCKRPMILVGPAGSLTYLRKYGFKTWSDFWDESYDEITDPHDRLDAIMCLIREIDSWSMEKCAKTLKKMKPILDHNRDHFFNNFPNIILDELKSNLIDAMQTYKSKAPNGFMLRRLSDMSKEDYEKLISIKDIPDHVAMSQLYDEYRSGNYHNVDKNLLRFIRKYLDVNEKDGKDAVLSILRNILA